MRRLPRSGSDAAVSAAVQHDIFGREPELAALRSELSVAMKGDGRLALVTGEPGMGKSRLRY